MSTKKKVCSKCNGTGHYQVQLFGTTAQFQCECVKESNRLYIKEKNRKFAEQYSKKGSK